MASAGAGHLYVVLAEPPAATSPQTVTAQIATLTLTAVPGAVTGATTLAAQVATLTLTGVAASRSTGSVTVVAQPAVLTLSAVAGSVAGTTVLLSDNFSGSSVDQGPWLVYNRCGDLVNSEVNAVIPANVTVSSGTLKIDSKFEDVTIGDSETAPAVYHYTSGQIAQGTVSFRYGSVQVRAKICGGTGTWPCIWMLGHDWQASQPYTANTPGHNWPNDAWWEIDIAEFMSGHRTLQNCALHFVTANRGGSGEKSIPFDATTRFMVYRLDWTATSLTWYIDAEDGNGWVQLLQITGTAGTDIPNTPGYLIIHTAVGGAGGTPSSGTFPVTTEVDYARITTDATSSVTVNAQPATLTLTAVAGTVSSGTQTRTAQIASTTLTAVPGTITTGAVTVTAQTAILSLTAVQGATSTGAVTKTAQVAQISLTAVPGTTSVAGLTLTAQIGVVSLTALSGAITTGSVSVTAQPSVLSLTAVQGVASGGGASPQTATAQIATVTLTAVQGTSTGGPTTTVAQPASLTLNGISGTSLTGPVTTVAQIAPLTLTAVPGISTGAGTDANPERLTLTMREAVRFTRRSDRMTIIANETIRARRR